MAEAAEYGIAANVISDGIARIGAKVFIVGGTGGEGWERFVIYGLSRGPRRISKWMPTKRLTNFRATWIPPKVRAAHANLYFQGGRDEMTRIAGEMELFAENLRQVAA